MNHPDNQEKVEFEPSVQEAAEKASAHTTGVLYGAFQCHHLSMETDVRPRFPNNPDIQRKPLKHRLGTLDTLAANLADQLTRYLKEPKTRPFVLYGVYYIKPNTGVTTIAMGGQISMELSVALSRVSAHEEDGRTRVPTAIGIQLDSGDAAKDFITVMRQSPTPLLTAYLESPKFQTHWLVDRQTRGDWEDPRRWSKATPEYLSVRVDRIVIKEVAYPFEFFWDGIGRIARDIG